MAAEGGRSGETAGYPAKIEIADSDEEVQAVFDVMKYLRDLPDAKVLLKKRVRQLQQDGYLLAILRDDGSALLRWLGHYARSHECKQLHLDSGVQRLDAHRFYEREGLEATSLHFRSVF